MEGSRLTIEQTEMIFNTKTIHSDASTRLFLDDIYEANNHFRLFDYILDHVDDLLTLDNIIKMNVILKQGTTYESSKIHNVGGFKLYENVIGSVDEVKTTSPKNVEKELKALLEKYNSLENVTVKDIVDFHYKFEKIHPFFDGNGRVGRIIMFKECLKNDIVPFVVLDKVKPYYINDLKNYENETNFLIDTCLHCQDVYESAIKKYLPDLKLEQEEDLSL